MKNQFRLRTFRPFAEAGRVRAYELSTGNIRWTSPIPGARRINSIAANDVMVSVDGGSASRDYYLFKADNGTVINTIAKGGSWDDNICISLFKGRIDSVDRKTLTQRRKAAKN